ncbi:MAG: type IX secretion system membrane protein PorP/SprF [Bacteroidales bacterium]|nr:type IX secretion system membrane protein PorP/SprF [Bacteroidales bacterium]
MKKQIIILLLATLTIQAVYSQQIPHFSQYTLNHYMLNPAATGTTETMPVAFTFRKLWAGIEGSPSVQLLSGDIAVADAMGAGIKIFNQQEGPLRRTGLEATYSYHLDLNSAGTKLSFGLSGLFYQVYLNKSELNVEDPDDEVFMGTDKMTVPDASFGMYLYDENYYVGLAVPQLFNRNVDFKTDGVLQNKQVRHYYFHGGYRFELNTDLKLEPSLLLKFVEAGLFQADINARVLYKDMLLGGLSFRTSEALVFQVGYQVQNFTIGYSFDLVLNALKAQTIGSHEIMLVYSLENFIR